MQVIDFHERSYLSQVRWLRKIADQAAKELSIKPLDLKFIGHGENATFKVCAKNKNYLLRLHRNDYHSPQALKEELKWLSQLTRKNDIQVQKPIPFANGKYLKKFAHNGYSRYCDLLKWQEGKMRYNNVTQKDFGELGRLLSYLHQNSLKKTNRKYWHANGLLGKDATFGSLSKLKDFLKKDFDTVENCRKMTLSKIQKYEKKHSDRTALIHADLHFGNIIWDKGRAVPIDFDDCGEGSFEYDFAVVFFASSAVFKKKTKKQRNSYANELFSEYSKTHQLSQESIDIIDYYRLARHLSMLAWLYDRRSNDRLLAHLKKTLKWRMAIYKKALKHGPESIFS